MTLNLVRVKYGKSDTKPEDREYQIDGKGHVGTMKEFRKMFSHENFIVEG